MKKIYLKACLNKNLGDDLFVKILVERYNKIKFYTSSVVHYNNRLICQNLHIKSGKHIRVINKIGKVILKKSDIVERQMYKSKDALIYVGGSIFMENNNIDVWKKSVDKYKNLNMPFFIIGANFGPYKTAEYVTLIKNGVLKKANDVCFRENYSYELFKELNNVRKASDLVFSLDISNIKIKNSKKVVMSIIDCRRKVKEEYQSIYEKKIIELTKFFINKDYEIVYMSYCKAEEDEKAIKSIIKKLDKELKKHIKVYKYRGNTDEALDVMADCQIVVGSRFHANILGLLLGKVVFPICYSDKTKNVLEDMDFKGKILDIKEIEKFDVNMISEEDLNYKKDVSFQIKDSKRHFEKIDELIREEGK